MKHTERPGPRLQDKSVLITGGTTGIGRASAELFHAHGARVMITGVQPSSVEQARRELGDEIVCLTSDQRSVSDSLALAKQIEARFGGLDVLFLNAGVAKLAPLGAIDEAHYSEQMDVNVKGVIFTLQAMLPLLRPGASVIVNTSVAGLVGAPNMAVYAATKGAVAAFVRTAALELAPRKVRVNALAPAMIHTAIQEKFGLPAEVRAASERDYSARIPLGRFGQAVETAQYVLFLASDESSFITGTELPIDGGLIVA